MNKEDVQRQVSAWRIQRKNPGWVRRQLHSMGIPSQEIEELVQNAYGADYAASQRRRNGVRVVGTLILAAGVALNIWTIFAVQGSAVVSGLFVTIALLGFFIMLFPDYFDVLIRHFS